MLPIDGMHIGGDFFFSKTAYCGVVSLTVRNSELKFSEYFKHRNFKNEFSLDYLRSVRLIFAPVSISISKLKLVQSQQKRL